MAWHMEEHGQGRPLVLLHGIASSLHIWDPLLPRLTAGRRVVTVDFPGHGASPDLAPHHTSAAALAADLVAELAERGIDAPFDVAGNSLGGWTALELAKLGAARSVVGLSPAGLWAGRTPPEVALQFRLLHGAGTAMPAVAPPLLRHPVGRALTLGSMFGRPWRIPPDQALTAYRGFVGNDHFLGLLEASAGHRFEGGAAIDVPVTVAFGRRDVLLHRLRCQWRGELPARTRYVTLPGCGHVPTWDDPVLVAGLILHGTACG